MSEHRQQGYPYFGIPPTRQPRPASSEPALRGKRVILSMPDGFVYDMRAASDAYTDGGGSAIVDVISEEHWFRWMFTQVRPEHRRFPLHLVWVE